MDPNSYLPTRGGSPIGGWSRGQNPITDALQRAKQQYDYEEALRRQRKAESSGLAMDIGKMFNTSLGSLGQFGGGLANIAGLGAIGTAGGSGEAGSMLPTTLLGDKAGQYMPGLNQSASAPGFQPPATAMGPPPGARSAASVGVRPAGGIPGQMPWWMQQYYMRGY